MRIQAAADEEELVLELDVRAGWHLYARPEGALAPLQRRNAGQGPAFELSFHGCDADSCRPVESVRLER